MSVDDCDCEVKRMIEGEARFSNDGLEAHWPALLLHWSSCCRLSIKFYWGQ